MAGVRPKPLSAWLAAGLCLCLRLALQAQSETPGATPGATRGSAEISLQGYYIGGSQTLSDTSGVGFHVREFVPNLGLLTGSFEGYGSNGQTQFGEVYAQLQGFIWAGRRWNFTAGDLRVPAGMVPFPFTNLVQPEISLRGLKVEASGKNRQYSVFFGRETLIEGPRIPFHVVAPQTVMGLTFRQKIGERLEIGARFLRLWSSPESIQENSFLFPANRQLTSADSLTLQSYYKLTSHLRLSGEATLSPANRLDDGSGIPAPSPVPFSYLAGPVFETSKVTARANYAYQGAAYLPVVGQFVGDRRGPFGELRYRPFKNIELYGSASRYSNNLENDPRTANLSSSSHSVGATANLPWRWSVSSQLSTIRFAGYDPETDIHRNTDNRQIAVSLARPIGRHQLHMTLRDIKILTLEQGAPLTPERERSAELEDHVSWSHFSLGGAVRAQGSTGDQKRNTLFYRGAAEAHFRRFSANAQIENGGDLLNRSVFATSTYKSTVFALATPLIKNWDLHFEAFRNTLTTDLNPESIFLLGNNGIDLSTSVAGFNQWSVFCKVTRQIGWGGPQLSGADLERYTIGQLQLMGSIEGFVTQNETAGNARVEGIPVTLDQSRTATTDAEGRYRFLEVPEGAHRVALSARELPAEFDPGPVAEMSVKVEPKRISRADLNVLPLGSAKGRITGPAGATLDEVLIRMEPGARYTTPDPEGNFYFFNLREGEYEVFVDASSLPPNAYLTSAGRLPLTISLGKEPASLEFEFQIRIVEKPVRKVLEQRISTDPNKMEPNEHR